MDLEGKKRETIHDKVKAKKKESNDHNEHSQQVSLTSK